MQDHVCAVLAEQACDAHVLQDHVCEVLAEQACDTHVLQDHVCEARAEHRRYEEHDVDETRREGDHVPIVDQDAVAQQLDQQQAPHVQGSCQRVHKQEHKDELTYWHLSPVIKQKYV